MDDIIEDLFKIYLSSIDSYNPKIYQTINSKYTIIDKSMITIYLFIKIIEDRKEKNQEITDALSNYLLKQIIYGEMGNISFEVSDKSKLQDYQEILDKLILEKFEYKNRLMKELKYNYKNSRLNRYSELLTFLEVIAEFAIFQKILLRGNQEIISLFNETKNKIMSQIKTINYNDYFYNEKKEIINLIINNKLNESQYGNLICIVLNLKDVYRYSQVTAQVSENVLFHQYAVAITSLLVAEYCNKKLKENINIYNIIVKSLFHDFGEYKGTEIITQIKNYNNLTKGMFAEIEKNDEKELEGKIGKNLHIIISHYNYSAEGFISEMVDKIMAMMKLWIEVGYFHNYNFIKTINSVYQEKLKRFLRVETINELKSKSFYIELLRECYIYVKEHLVEKDLDYFLKYFTQEELDGFREEIKLLKNKPETFLE